MMNQIREEDLKKLKNKLNNYRQQERTRAKKLEAAKEKAAFNDTDKLIMVEGVLLQVLNKPDLALITQIVFSKLQDDEFWNKHKHDSIEKIIQALKKSVMN